LTGALTYYHADGLGSVVRRTNQAAAVVHEYRYDAWGNIEAGGSEPGYSFTGREWDPEIGLYYYRARYYDPSAGVFLSEDAATDFGIRAYAQNSPTDLVDPSGYAADLNLFNKTKYPYEWDVAANYMSAIEGYFVVAAHGNATAVLDDNLQWLNPSQLADRIRAEGWTKCRKVFVFACNVGRLAYAKQLAQELGVEVRAPNGYIRFKKEYAPWGVSPEGDTVYVTFKP
jgi:RHS repeat-associated protein